VIDSLVGVTFFNSNVDRDILKVFSITTYVFYSHQPPKNLFGPVYLESTSNYEELHLKTVLLQSRLVKFFPWRYINDYDFFVYHDYRIDVHKIFFKELQINQFPLFLKHREGGLYIHELLRNFERGRIGANVFPYVNRLINGRFDLPIMENGVVCLQKSNYMDVDLFLENFEVIKRDQLVVPVLLNEKFTYFKYNLNHRRYFHVNSKKFKPSNLFFRFLSFIYARL